MQTTKYFVQDKKTKQLLKPGPGADFFDSPQRAVECADSLNQAEMRRSHPFRMVEAVRLTIAPLESPKPLKIKRGERVKLERFMKRMTAEAEKEARKFRPHIWVQPEHGIIEVVLEGVACYHEWITKEGGDMSVWRAMDDDRVVGATLPLRSWNGYLGYIVD